MPVRPSTNPAGSTFPSPLDRIVGFIASAIKTLSSTARNLAGRVRRFRASRALKYIKYLRTKANGIMYLPGAIFTSLSNLFKGLAEKFYCHRKDVVATFTSTDSPTTKFDDFEETTSSHFIYHRATDQTVTQNEGPPQHSTCEKMEATEPSTQLDMLAHDTSSIFASGNINTDISTSQHEEAQIQISSQDPEEPSHSSQLPSSDTSPNKTETAATQLVSGTPALADHTIDNEVSATPQDDNKEPAILFSEQGTIEKTVQKSSPLDTLSPAVVDKEIVTTQVVVPNIAEFTFQNPVVNQINLGDLTAGEFDPERSFNAARLPNFNSSLGVNPIEDHPTGSDFWTSAHVEVNHDYSAQEDEESSEVGQEDRVDNPENSPSPASSEHAVDGEDLNVESSNNTSLDEINTNPSEDQEDFPNVKSNELHIEPNISPLKILMEPRIGGKDFVTVFHFDTEAEDEDIPIEDDKAMESSDDQSVDEETQCQKYTTLPCTPQKSPNAGNKDEDSPPIYSPKADISQQSSSPRSILSTTTSFSDSDVIKTVPRWKAKFPIRVCDKGPQPFSLEDQKLKLRYYFINRFDSRLEFLAHPEIELIKDTVRPYLDLLGASGDNITVEHLAKGGFNHAYTLSIGDEQTGAQKQYVFRVAYPTDPYYKMECDVATTEFVRHSTDIPVPIIYIFDSSSNNKLGFEWMLMEKAAGRAVSEVWKDMDYESKINLTHQVADRMDHLSRLEFKKIGGLRMRFTESELEFYVGPIVHGEFYKERRLTHIQNRGPFETLQDYYSAMLDVIEQDVNDPRHKLRLGLRNKLNDPLSELTQELHAILPDIQDRVDTTPKQKALEKRRFDDEDNELMLARAKIDYMEGEHSWGLQPRHLDALVPAIKALKTSLPILCAAAEVPGDFSTMLMHQDLSMNNIFVDERGQIVALIDWEHIQLEPATLIAGCPIFLETDVTSMPSGPGKATNTQSISQEMIDEINQSNQEFYEDQMAEYEKVELYAVYRERLEELKSPILQSLNVDKSGFGYELYSRVFDTVTECFTHVDWVKYHTEGTDDEAEAKESGEVDVESSIETGEDMRCMGGVDDEEALKWKEEEEKARKKRKHGNKGKKGKNRSKSKRTAAKRAKTEKLEM